MDKSYYPSASDEIQELCKLFDVKYNIYTEKRCLREVVDKIKEHRKQLTKAITNGFSKFKK